LPETDEHLLPGFRKLEAENKRREARVKQVLKAMDDLHESFDARGWASQKGQALLDLMFTQLTQVMAENAELQGQVADLSLRLSLLGKRRPMTGGELERRRNEKLAHLRTVAEVKELHPDMKQTELAELVGLTPGRLSILLADARAEGLL